MDKFFEIIQIVLRWLFIPLKWWRDDRCLRKFIRNRRFKFMYCPFKNQNKTVTFLLNGEIGEGKNNNENSWRIRRGTLEILGADGKFYSSFRFDYKSGHLIHTNDPNSRSILNQYFEPEWQKVSQP
jgi:hypothetical protein